MEKTRKSARKTTSVPTLRQVLAEMAVGQMPKRAADVPTWDSECRELRLGDGLVKQFRVPAECQERLLASFEELGWPRHMDDPLPPQRGQDRKRRLNRTIESLNRSQKHRLIRFRGDGTGCGVRWEPIVGRSPVDRG